LAARPGQRGEIPHKAYDSALKMASCCFRLKTEKEAECLGE
jgi:hypothetical protein